MGIIRVEAGLGCDLGRSKSAFWPFSSTSQSIPHNPMGTSHPSRIRRGEKSKQ